MNGAWIKVAALGRAGTTRLATLHAAAKGPRLTVEVPILNGLVRTTRGWQAPPAAASGALHPTAVGFLTVAVTTTVSPGRYDPRSVTTDNPTCRVEHAGKRWPVPTAAGAAATGDAAVRATPTVGSGPDSTGTSYTKVLLSATV